MALESRFRQALWIFILSLTIAMILKPARLTAATFDEEEAQLKQQFIHACGKHVGQAEIACVLLTENLAAVYSKQGRFAEAESAYQRALATKERRFGTDDVRLVATLKNLAEAYKADADKNQWERLAPSPQQRDKYAKSEGAYKRALSIEEKKLGPNDLQVGDTVVSLANFYRFSLGSKYYVEAERLYARALAIRKKVLGVGSTDVTSTAQQLFDFFIGENKPGQAEALYKSLLQERQQALGPDDISVADTAQQLADFYKNKGRSSEADELYRRSLAIRENKLGPRDPVVATTLSAMAETQMAQRNYGNAEQLLKRVLEIRKQAVTMMPVADRSYGDIDSALLNLAAAYKGQGKLIDEEQAFKQALSLVEQSVAENLFDADLGQVAIHLGFLAAMYEERGQYSESIASLRRILSIEEQKYGSIDFVGLFSFGNPIQHLIDLYEKLGQYHDAYQVKLRNLEILQREVSAREQALAGERNEKDRDLFSFENARDGLTDVLVKAAEALSQIDRYDESLGYYKRALDVLNLGKPSLSIRRDVLSEEASLYDELGRASDADAAREEIARIYLQDATSQVHVSSLYPDGEVFSALAKHGRYQEAENLLNLELRVIRGSSDNLRLLPSILMQLGAVREGRGLFAGAESAYKEALSIVKSDSRFAIWEEGLCLIDLMHFYRSHGRPQLADESLARLRQIDAGLWSSSGDDNGILADFYLELRGSMYQELGEQNEAESSFARLIKLLQRKTGAESFTVAAALDRISFGYAKWGNNDLALTYSRRATEMIVSGAGSRGLLGEGREALGSSEERQPSPHFQVDTINQEDQYHLDYFSHYLLHIAAVARERPRLQDALGREAMEIAQRAHGSSTATALQQTLARFAAGSDALAALLRQERSWAAFEQDEDERLGRELSKSLSDRNTGVVNLLRKEIADTETKLAANSARVAQDFPAYAALANPEPLKVEQAQDLLGPDEALVFFSIGNKESYVFALTRGTFDWKIIPFGARAIEARVTAFRRGLDVDEISSPIKESKKSDLFDLQLANDLYVALLGQVEPIIKEKKELLIVPSGALTAVPFHLLVTERPAAPKPDEMSAYRDAAWLIKRQAVTVLPSVASLKALRILAHSDEARKPMVGFGDPQFDPNAFIKGVSRSAGKFAARSLTTRSYADFFQGGGVDRARLAEDLPPLPETADELKAVAKDLGAPSSDLHLGKDASETEVKSLPLADYRIVYFATHGLVAGDVKGLGEPSLALSIPVQPSDLDDGLLTASEVAQLKLNANWVVLSACNTIAGDRPGAEALSGLARAFFYAGARALLVSHWAVSSEAATRLTTSTFDILKANPTIGRAEALRRAELAYLNDTSDPNNAYPALWGPFEIVGEGSGQ
jgi:CHAT domain-containing protein